MENNLNTRTAKMSDARLEELHAYYQAKWHDGTIKGADFSKYAAIRRELRDRYFTTCE